MDTKEIPATFEIIEPKVVYYILRPDFNDLLIYSDSALAYDPFLKTYFIYYDLDHSSNIVRDFADPDELVVLYASSLHEYRVWCRDDDVTLALDSLTRYIYDSTTKRMNEIIIQSSKVRKQEQHLLNIINNARNQ